MFIRHIVDQNLVFAGESCTWFHYMNTGDLEPMATQLCGNEGDIPEEKR